MTRPLTPFRSTDPRFAPEPTPQPQETTLAEIPDNELPGMWERADFMGGQEEVRGQAPSNDQPKDQT